jgi:hypothetical protein
MLLSRAEIAPISMCGSVASPAASASAVCIRKRMIGRGQHNGALKSSATWQLVANDLSSPYMRALKTPNLYWQGVGEGQRSALQ